MSTNSTNNTLDEVLKSISPNFVQSSLATFVNQTFELEDTVLSPVVTLGAASKKGDAYLSIVKRFTIKATGKLSNGALKEVAVPVIAKMLPTNVAHRKTFRCSEFFFNEYLFYEVWESLKRFLVLRGATDLTNCIPLCVSSTSEADYIALEDLSPKGFLTCSRGQGLDLSHTKLIMTAFARFHAASLAWKDQQPQDFQKASDTLTETYFSEKQRDWYINFQTKKLLPLMRDAIVKQLPPRYVSKFDALCSTDFFGTVIRLAAKRTPLTILTHGDVWIPNFLFKYANEEEQGVSPQSVVMIDFQLARCGSVAFDLIFFLYACAEESVQANHWEELLDSYHATFAATLKRLGSKSNLLTREALDAELRANAGLGVAMAMEAITMSMLEDDEAADLDDIQGDEKVPLEVVWDVKPFESQEKQRRIASFVKHAIDNEFI